MNGIQRIISIAILSLFFFVLPVHGAIEPPFKEIDYCYRINNIDDYPEFTFLARFQGYGDMQLNAGDCFSRQSADEIVAARKNGLSAEALSSGITAPVSPVKVYDLEDPRKKIEDVFTIDMLDDERFELLLTKRITQRDDGTIQERVYATMEEGMTDSIAPGYEYGYMSSKNSISQSPPAYGIIPLSYRNPRETPLKNFLAIAIPSGIILVILFNWSDLVLMLKRGQHVRYRRIALSSLFLLTLIVILYLIFSWLIHESSILLLSLF
ncbi:MAG: hypothetical protein AAB855_05275 [Patescibacteria group bacterium]